jgi:hypothetical protein
MPAVAVSPAREFVHAVAACGYARGQPARHYGFPTLGGEVRVQRPILPADRATSLHLPFGDRSLLTLQIARTERAGARADRIGLHAPSGSATQLY